ncbi:MAG TPA: ornithine carbamoyltransferase, partial [Thermoleophilia bacterium]|nr:ornithine carbamoyltransferase [Thermoleophilia bacterium]
MNDAAAGGLAEQVAELGLKGTSFLTMHHHTPAQIARLLDLAAEIKALSKAGAEPKLLDGRSVAMIFMKTSTRTRISFEVGITQLGAQALFLNANDIQLRVGETIKDTAHVLSCYVDAIMIRTFAQHDVEDLRDEGSIPVINGLTDDWHPCQAMADLLTIREHFGELAGRRLVYVGDGNNVAHSLMIGGAKTGMHVTVATPVDHQPKEWVVEWARQDAVQTGATIELTTDLRAAVTGVDVVYTDTWTSMGQEAEAAVREQRLGDFQVNGDLLVVAGPQARVMHCLPAHWGKEITEEVLYSPQSIVFDQAENRLHAQKAIMAALIG